MSKEELPVETECKQCGDKELAWKEDAATHICFDCFACNEEKRLVEEEAFKLVDTV